MWANNNYAYIFLDDFSQHSRGGWSSGFIPIAEYGGEFRKILRTGKPREVVRLLYSGKNHYDLLIWLLNDEFNAKLHDHTILDLYLEQIA